VRRAYELWRELELEADEQLLYVTGIIEAGERIYEGALSSCHVHDLPHEELDGREVARRYPAYRFPPDAPMLFQPNAGFLLPERCIVAHVEGALARGGVVRARERVLGWDETTGGVRVETERGSYEAERLVVTAGAWAQEVARLAPGLVVAQRQVLAWLQPLRPELFIPERLPVFNIRLDEGHFYGFPVFGVPGFKLGRYYHLDERGDPDELFRGVKPEDEPVLRTFAEDYFPDGAGPTMALKTCLFELSPDEHFLVDRHPEAPSVVVGAGFSGHGFKFCSVLGEILADLALDGETRHDIGLFRLDRFD
jgi:sarcosine oxidase